jgi:hypothetical protein
MLAFLKYVCPFSTTFMVSFNCWFVHVFRLDTLGCLLVAKLCIVTMLLVRNVDSFVLLRWSIGDVSSFGLHNWYLKPYFVAFLAHWDVLESNLLLVHPWYVATWLPLTYAYSFQPYSFWAQSPCTWGCPFRSYKKYKLMLLVWRPRY